MKKTLLMIVMMLIAINSFGADKCNLGSTYFSQVIEIEIDDIQYSYVGDKEFKYCSYTYEGKPLSFDCSNTELMTGDTITGSFKLKCGYAPIHIPTKILKPSFEPNSKQP